MEWENNQSQLQGDQGEKKKDQYEGLITGEQPEEVRDRGMHILMKKKEENDREERREREEREEREQSWREREEREREERKWREREGREKEEREERERREHLEREERERREHEERKEKERKERDKEEKDEKEKDVVSGMENLHLTQVEKLQGEEEEKEKDKEGKKEGFIAKLNRAGSSSSSSSSDEEEVGPDGEKRKKKKGAKDKIKEKIGQKKEEMKPRTEKETATEQNLPLTQVEKLQGRVEEEDKKDKDQHGKKEGIMSKLSRSSSSSSSSSDEEEVGPDGVKRKKKKGVTEKIKEKLGGGERKDGTKPTENIKEKLGAKKEEKKPSEETKTATTPVIPEDAPITPPTSDYPVDTSVNVEKVDENTKLNAPHQDDEKKGFLGKIKEKLPGHHQKKTALSPTSTEEVNVNEPVPTSDSTEETHNGATTTTTTSTTDGKEKKGIIGKIMDKIKGGEHKEGEKTAYKEGEKTPYKEGEKI